MSAERSINTQEQLLAKMPTDARALCDWGWTTLRDTLIGWGRAFGMDPIASTRTASRIARLVCVQLYGDVLEYRRIQQQVKRAIVLALLLGAPATAAAQTSTPASTAHKLAWDQAGATLAEAQANQYFLVVDGARSTQPMLPIACTGAASPFVCSTPFPSLTPGDHTITLITARMVNGVLVESAQSLPLRVTMVLVSSPTNLRVQ